MASTFSSFVLRFCAVFVLARPSVELPTPQSTSLLKSLSTLDAAWQALRGELIDVLQNSTATQTPPVTPSPAPNEGALVTKLRTASTPLERCLDVVTLPLAGSSGNAYIGFIDSHTCLNSTIGDEECVNNRRFCSSNSTLRDLGVDYFPRFVAEYSCSGCDPDDEGCLAANQRCSVVPLMLTPKVLRTVSGTWRLVNVPTSLVAYCDCRKS